MKYRFEYECESRRNEPRSGNGPTNDKIILAKISPNRTWPLFLSKQTESTNETIFIILYYFLWRIFTFFPEFFSLFTNRRHSGWQVETSTGHWLQYDRVDNNKMVINQMWSNNNCVQRKTNGTTCPLSCLCVCVRARARKLATYRR